MCVCDRLDLTNIMMRTPDVTAQRRSKKGGGGDHDDKW